MKSIDIYEDLKAKYEDYIKSNIVSIKMLQTEEDVILETIEETKDAKGETVYTRRRTDLYFIIEDEENDEPFFNPEGSSEENARKLIDEYDAYSIANTLDLFYEEVCVDK